MILKRSKNGIDLNENIVALIDGISFP